MMMKYFFLLLVSFLSPLAMALPISDASFTKFASPFMEFPAPQSTYLQEHLDPMPFYVRIFMNDWLRYEPDTSASPISQKCDIEKWQEEAQSKSNFSEITGFIANYFNDCEEEFKNSFNVNLWTGYRSLMLKFDSDNYPYGRYVILNLPGGIRVKAFLALKGDDRKRPLVIIRGGIFSPADNFRAERFEFMQLFEQSPFNVLLLESTTSSEFFQRNKAIIFGGFEEGIQDFEIAKQLQDPNEPIAKLIDSVHLVSVSMGGNGLFFSALLSSLAKEPVIQSAIAYCPLVNFRKTLDFHIGKGPENKLGDFWISQRLPGIEKIAPQISSTHFLDGLLQYLKDDYKVSPSLQDDLPLPATYRSHLRDFWFLNDFWPYYKNVKTPVLVFANSEDPLVPYEMNSKLLKSRDLPIGDSRIEVVQMNYGWHCTVPGSYQWKPMASMAQSYLLQMSSQFHMQAGEQVAILNPEAKSFIEAKGFHPQLRISAGRAADFVVQAWLPGYAHAIAEWPIKFAEIGWAEAPFSSSRPLLERWVQQNMHLKQLPEGLRLKWRF